MWMPRWAYGLPGDDREAKEESGGGREEARRESAVPPVANLVTRARISADLYRRQLHSVPARRGPEKGWVGSRWHGPAVYVRVVHTWRRGRMTRGII